MGKKLSEQRIPVTLFSDAFTSMLDKRFFSMCLVDLINAKATGITTWPQPTFIVKKSSFGKLQIK